MPPRFVLIGPPGSGKSSVGSALARQLQLKFVDSDKVITARAGKPISDIFVYDGEAAFRVLEREVVAQELKDADGVLALGGGSVLNEETQQDLNQARKTGTRVIFLDISLSKAAPRIGFNRDRPLLLGNPRAQWSMLMETRRPIYESLADLIIDTGLQAMQNTVTEIVTKLGEP